MESNKLRKRLFTAFYINIIVAITVICVVTTFNDGDSKYLRFGWHDDLTVLGYKINNKSKYICLIALLGLLEAIDVYVNDTIYPYIQNNVRNNNVKHIADFTKSEIRLLTNGTYFLSSIKYSLYVMVSISQIDIALIKVLIGEITCLFTTDVQLSEKTFKNNQYDAIPEVEIVGIVDKV